MSTKILLRFLPWAVCLTVPSAVSWADSIDLDGKTYTGVYIVEEKAMYYVKVPETGQAFPVLKTSVTPEAVKISENADERKKLLDAFRKKRAPSLATPLPKKAASPGKPHTPPKKKVPTPPAVKEKTKVALRDTSHGFNVDGHFVVTNKSKQELSGAAPRRVFQDKKGILVLTNLPEKYEDSDDYIERSLGFRNIDIPARFKTQTARPLPPRYSSAQFENIKEMVAYYAKYYALEETLVCAVIRQESDFDPNSVSSAGARGLMQLMPGTALEMGVTDIFDPAQNIAGGCQYLSKMLEFCNGNLQLAVAAYNAGPGSVKKYGFTIPPYAETQDYVRKVLRYKSEFENQGYGGIRFAQSHPVEPGFIPGDHKGKFEVLLNNGLTEIADEVMEKGACYFLKRGERLRSVPKDKVKEVKNLA